MKHKLKESDFDGYTVHSVIAGNGKVTLSVKTDVDTGDVKYCVKSKESEISEYTYLDAAIEMYNKLCAAID